MIMRADPTRSCLGLYGLRRSRGTEYRWRNVSKAVKKFWLTKDVSEEQKSQLGKGDETNLIEIE